MHAGPEIETAGKKIIYSMLREKDVEQTVDCMVDTFQDEPMTKALDITKDEFKYLAELYATKAAKERLSIVAKDGDGSVIGFCISEDLISGPPEGIYGTNEKFRPIIDLLSSLDENYMESKPYDMENGDTFHLFMAGVKEPYRSTNVASALIDRSLGLANSRGFSCAIAEATGPVSQHILRDKFGFAEKFSVDYEQFVYGGDRVFESIREPRSCILMEKRLKKSSIELHQTPFDGEKYVDRSLNPEDIAIPKPALVELVYAYGELNDMEREDVNRIIRETIVEKSHKSDCFEKLDYAIAKRNQKERVNPDNDPHMAMCNGVPVW